MKNIDIPRSFKIVGQFVFVVIFLLWFASILTGCHKGDKTDSPGNVTSTMDPFAQDEDDKGLNESEDIDNASPAGGWVEVSGRQESPTSSTFNAAGGRCMTFTLDRLENGNRKGAKIRKPLWNYFGYASVRFSDGFYVPRVNMRKANRINTKNGRGFVSRLGNSYTGIYVLAPYGRRPTSVQYCAVR